MRREQRFYGRGMKFPLVRDTGFAWISGGDAVAQSLRSILLTEPGERIGRPAYGAGLRSFLFSPNNVGTRAVIARAVEEAVLRDESRIELEAVEVLPDPAERTLLHIDIRYRLAGQPGMDNFVFPFYLEES